MAATSTFFEVGDFQCGGFLRDDIPVPAYHVGVAEATHMEFQIKNIMEVKCHHL